MIVDQTYKLKIPPYPLDVVISFTQSKKLFKEEIKRALGVKDSKGLNIFDDHFSNSDFKNRSRTVRLASGNVVVALSSIDHGIIAHELFHAATLYLDSHGVVCSLDSNEVYAYTIQYLTTIVYQIIKENEGIFITE